VVADAAGVVAVGGAGDGEIDQEVLKAKGNRCEARSAI